MIRLLWILLIMTANVAVAEQEDMAAARLEIEPEYSSLDRSRDWLAKQVEGFSGGLDSFFIERFFNEKVLDDDINGSRAVISLHTRRIFGEGVEYKLDAKLKLELPHTQDRLKLLIRSEDDSEYAVDRDPLRSVENATYSTSVRYVISEAKKWETDADVGIRLKIPFNPFVRLRTYRYFDFMDWRSRFTQSLLYYHIDGWVEKSDFFMDYNFSEDKLFRLSTNADYYLLGDYFELNYGIGLYQKLKNNAMLAYLAGASGDTKEGAILNGYFAGIKYRRRIYKDWIYAEIMPQLEWNEERNYQRLGAVMFRLEAIIDPEN